MVDAFLFDLDGVLVDTEPLYMLAAQSSLSDMGHSLPCADLVAIVYGKAWKDALAVLDSLFPGIDAGELGRRIVRHYTDASRGRDIGIHGSIALLRDLSVHSPVAVVSGSTRHEVGRLLERIAVESNVAFFIGAEDYEAGKPDPACYLLAAERLSLPPGRCLAFEDSLAGVRAAKSAGMFCVALKREENPSQDLELADEVLPDLSRFRLERWRAGNRGAGTPRPSGGRTNTGAPCAPFS